MKKPSKEKLRPVDLLDEEAYLTEKRTQSSIHSGGGLRYSEDYGSTGSTITWNSSKYDLETMPRFQEKKYTQDDMDKIVMTLTLYIDDQKTRAIVDDVYQSLKDSMKI